MEEGIIHCDVMAWLMLESPGLTEPAAIRTLMEAGPMHKQVSEKTVEPSRKASWQETITKGTGWARPKRRSENKWPKRTERTQ
jgi:hypothetical protein